MMSIVRSFFFFPSVQLLQMKQCVSIVKQLSSALPPLSCASDGTKRHATSLSSNSAESTASIDRSRTHGLHRHAFTGDVFPNDVQSALSKFMMKNNLIGSFPPLWVMENQLQLHGPILPEAVPAAVQVLPQRKMNVVPISCVEPNVAEWLLQEYPVKPPKTKHNARIKAKEVSGVEQSPTAPNASQIPVLEYECRGEFKVPGVVWKFYSRRYFEQSTAANPSRPPSDVNENCTAAPPSLPLPPGPLVGTETLQFLELAYHKPSTEWYVNKHAKVVKFYHCSALKQFAPR